MSEERLSEALGRFLVASDWKRSDQPNMPYVKIMGPTVDDVVVVRDAVRRVLEPIPESVRLRFIAWVKSDSNELYDLVEIYRQYLLNGESV